MLNNGDYVTTKNGKIAAVVYDEYWELKSHALIYTYNGDKEGAERECKRLQDIYPVTMLHQKPFIATLINAKVKFIDTDKELSVHSNTLTKLDKLAIVTQQGISQHTNEYPIEDAKTIMDIYKRNNIWFCVKTIEL
jgi:hypothetical protein